MIGNSGLICQLSTEAQRAAFCRGRPVTKSNVDADEMPRSSQARTAFSRGVLVEIGLILLTKASVL